VYSFLLYLSVNVYFSVISIAVFHFLSVEDAYC